MKRSTLILAMSLLLASCGSGGDFDPWSDLIGRSWSALAGESSDFQCTGIKVTSDIYITGFRTLATQTSGGGSYRVLLWVNDSPTQTLGDFDCNDFDLGADVIYASALGTEEIRFPAGVAAHVKAGQNLILNVQLVTTAALSGSTRIQVLTGPPVDTQHEVDMTLSGTTNIVGIPSDGMPHQVTGGCVAGSDWNIFAFFPLMHGAGTHQELRLNGVTVFDSEFSPAQQHFHVPPSPIAIHQGDQILQTCTYVNNSGQTLPWGGDFTHGELCYNGLYRYPKPANANFFDCTSH